MPVKQGSKPQPPVEPDDQDQPMPSREEMAYAIKEVQMQKYDTATEAALNLLIAANYPVSIRMAMYKLREEMGFDNTQWNPKPANAQPNQ